MIGHATLFEDNGNAIDYMYKQNFDIISPDKIYTKYFPDSDYIQQKKIMQLNSGTNIWTSNIADRVVTMHRVSTKQRYISLQKWEGVVLDIADETFTAKLIDISRTVISREICELSKDEVPQEDLDLLEKGAIFYWSIGYHDTARGQRYRQSMIRFRRLPMWSKNEIDTSLQQASTTAAAIGWGI